MMAVGANVCGDCIETKGNGEEAWGDSSSVCELGKLPEVG